MFLTKGKISQQRINEALSTMSENTREYYREQGRKQERDRMGFALVQILADREKAADGGEYSQTFSFFDIMRIVEGI